jgi:hypothetical protein
VLVLTARADIETRPGCSATGEGLRGEAVAAEELQARVRNLLETKRAADVLRGE